MKSSRLWGYIYLFMGSSFVMFAIQQKTRIGGWDFFIVALMAIAAYDFMIAINYLTFKPKKGSNKQD